MTSSKIGGWPPTDIPPGKAPPPRKTFLGRFWSQKDPDQGEGSALRAIQEAGSAFVASSSPTCPPIKSDDERVRGIIAEAAAYLNKKDSPFPHAAVKIGRRTFEVAQRGNTLSISGFGKDEDITGEFVEQIMGGVRGQKGFDFGTPSRSILLSADEKNLSASYAREYLNSLPEIRGSEKKKKELDGFFSLSAQRSQRAGPTLEIVCDLNPASPPAGPTSQSPSQTPSPTPSAVPPPHKRQRTDTKSPEVAKLRGLENPGCLCYFNASLLALCASPAFRRELSSKQNLTFARLLENVFRDMEDQGRLSEPLSIKQKGSPLEQLYTALCATGKVDFLRNIARQQDAQELVGPLLELATKEQTFGLVTKKDCYAETRDLRLAGLHIPNVDTKAPPARESMVMVEIPEGASDYSVDTWFTGTLQHEKMEIGAIIGSEYNQGRFWSGRRERLREEETYGEPFSEVSTMVSHQLQHPAPASLPVYISRFTARGEKNAAPIAAPFHLAAPMEGGGQAEYELKSVVIHEGKTKAVGHYSNCIPDPSSPINEEGYPSMWTVASDSRSKRVLPWSAVKEQILRNGVLFMYDKVEARP